MSTKKHFDWQVKVCLLCFCFSAVFIPVSKFVQSYMQIFKVKCLDEFEI